MIRWLTAKDRVALVGRRHLSCGARSPKGPIRTRLPTGKGKHRRFLARILT